MGEILFDLISSVFIDVRVSTGGLSWYFNAHSRLM